MAILRFYALAILFVSANAQSQNPVGYPEIGKKVPEFFIDNVLDYSSSEISPSYLEGRFYILDFWSTDCSTCISSLREIDELRKRHKRKLEIIMIGHENEEGRERLVYEKLKRRFNLSLPVTFDSSVFSEFVHFGVPQLLWIDDKGIIQAITSTSDLNSKNIELFLAKKKFDFVDMSFLAHRRNLEFDRKTPFLTDGNGGSDRDFDFRSLVTSLKPDMPLVSFARNLREVVNEGMIQGCGTLQQLYFYAYSGYSFVHFYDSLYGYFYPSLVFELEDSTEFLHANLNTGEGFYWYSLVVPPGKANARYMMSIMQRDLQSYFGYEGKIEVRDMPYFKLIASPKARKSLKTRGDDKHGQVSPAGIKLSNFPVKSLIRILFSNHTEKGVFLDGTEIDASIDIQMDVVRTDFADLLRALRENGLDLVRDKKKMQVIVISTKEM